MPRPTKGQRTPGAGRKKGTPNKKTTELIQLCEKHGVTVGEGLIFAMKHARRIFDERRKKGNLVGALSALDRVHAADAELAQYVYPKKKSIEHSGEIGVKTFADFVASAESPDDEDDEEC